MKIIKNVQATHYKSVDFNVDTIYLRSNVKFYKIINDETNEKELLNITIEEFNNLDIKNLCIYDEEQYTYNECIDSLKKRIINVDVSVLKYSDYQYMYNALTLEEYTELTELLDNQES